MLRNLFNSGITIETRKGIVFLFPNINAKIQLDNTIQKLTANGEKIGYVLHHEKKYLKFIPIYAITKQNEINGYYTFKHSMDDMGDASDVYNYFPLDKKDGLIQHIYIASSGYKGINLTRSTYKEISKINNFPGVIYPNTTSSNDNNLTLLTGSGKELTIYLLHSNKMYYIFRISFNNNTYIINNISYKQITFSLSTVHYIQQNNTLVIDIKKPYILNMSESENSFKSLNTSQSSSSVSHPTALRTSPPSTPPPPPSIHQPSPPTRSNKYEPVKHEQIKKSSSISSYTPVEEFYALMEPQNINILFNNLEELKSLTAPIENNTYSYKLIKLLKNGYKFNDFYNSLVNKMKKFKFREQIYKDISNNIIYIRILMANDSIKNDNNRLQKYINSNPYVKELYYYHSAMILLEIVRLIKLINEDTLKNNVELLEVINSNFTKIFTNIDLTDKDKKTALVIRAKWKNIIIELHKELDNKIEIHENPYALPHSLFKGVYAEVRRTQSGGSRKKQYYKFKSSELLNL